MNKTISKENAIVAYKAFDENFRCRDFQYEVGKEYEIKGKIKCCKRGFHACESPMEVFDYYDMFNSRFAEVEQSGQIDKEDDNKSTKICSSRIKIKTELKLADIINLGIEWLKDITSSSKVKADTYLNDNGGDSAQIVSSGYSAQIGSSGYFAKIGSSGDYAQIGSIGYFAKIGSSGDYSKIGSSGKSAKIGSSGDDVKIGSIGDYSKIGSSGYYAQICSSGDYAKIGSSGDSAQIGSSGDSAKIGSSGDSAKINSTGEYSVIMCAGKNSAAKAKAGSWITLSEWVYDEEKGITIPKCVKTEYVDGKRIKADTWYQLKKGKFIEVNV